MKSFSAVNMCRSVILGFIFASFVSCVLADTAQAPNNTKNACVNDTLVKSRRDVMKTCFSKLVEVHLNPETSLQPSDCKTAADFGLKLDAYFFATLIACNKTWKYNTSNIVKLVDFSLKNNTFKTFYEDINCVKGVETNISNSCVKKRLGHFDIRKDKKHLPWYGKDHLYYNTNTCASSEAVRNCTMLALHQCKHSTADYVMKLFDFVRELGNCSQFPPLATVPPPSGIGAPATAASWLTIPVIITLAIGGVVVLGAIITIIVLKCKN